MVQINSYVILSYKIKHNYNIKDFLNSYRYLLQTAINIIWDNINWIERKQRNYYLIRNGKRFKRKYYHVKRLIPIIPKSREFKRNLRDSLLKDWKYASHYVDSAIKVAYSIINSWRRNYFKGKRRKNKPIVKRKFVRVKETLYVYRNDKIRITVRPRELYLEFDLSNTWFGKRVNGWDLGELIIKENELIITFRKEVSSSKHLRKIAWDMNLLSMDGFCDKGWIKINLKPLYTLHITYENKRRKIQSLAKRKPRTAKKLSRKYNAREVNRVKDFLHKLTTKLVEEFKDYEHGFENLEKQDMYNRYRRHNREVSKQNWKQIIQFMKYKAFRVQTNIDPKGTSSTCPLCGERLLKLRKGQVVKCRRCSLVLDRQLRGAINIYLRMRGFPSSPSIFYRVVIKKMISLWKMQMRRGRGVTLKGGETDDILPMNPEGVEVDVSQGEGLSINVYLRRTPSPAEIPSWPP